MGEMTYPISLMYVIAWSFWEILRELVSNARDTKTSYSWKVENNTLTVMDEGEGLAIRQLLLGVHESAEGSVGQFGEGLKLALLVATRLGLHVTIRSGNKIINNSSVKIDDIDVLRLTWDDAPYQKGTIITIDNWTAGDFRERFLLEEDMENTIITNTSGSVLESPRLYNKGVYVCDLENYAFGYDLEKLTMNRDRSAVSETAIHQAVGDIWRKVNNPYAWKYFFQGAKENKLESQIEMYTWNTSDEVKNSIREGFTLAYGEKAVIQTSDDNEREAKHRGAEVVDPNNFGYYMKEIVLQSVKTDQEYIKEKGGLKIKTISASKLNEDQKKNLAIAKRMVKRLERDYSIEIVESLPSGCAHADPSSNTIRMLVYILNDVVETKSTMIHELAHLYYKCYEDVTERHVEACCKIGALLS